MSPSKNERLIMNQRAYITLDVEKNGRIYVLSLPLGAPFSECHEAIKEFGDVVSEMEKVSAEQAEAAKVKEEPIEVAFESAA